ncbi:MAG: 50S ribosomal protein L9 [Phycisphaeraceae bacterium]|nr:50S ribosomal protein L9 [Phycisphaeraceae bacterium]
MATKKRIKLLLTENVDNLGIVGDVVEVRPGYARNYLYPHGLATEPSEYAMRQVEERRAEVERQLREARAEKEQLIAKLEGIELTIQRAANEDGHLYGSVSQHDIAEALQTEGFNIQDRDVRIGELIKQLDSYEIPIQIENDLKTTIKLWVVSDKPAEQLEADAAEATEGQEAAEETEAASTEEPTA